MKSAKIIICLFVILLSCNSSSREAEIKIRNDIQDSEYNKITIEEIRHAGGTALNKYNLTPGNEIALPYKRITQLKVSREYKDYTSIYEVTCPAQKKAAIIKLIDIYLNRMPSGCRLSKAGEQRGGVVVWK
jgi:hypothetical protein